MAAKAKADWILSQIGDPKKIAQDLRKFRKSSEALSTDYSRLLKTYPKKWVVVHDGEVKASGTSLKQVLKRATDQRLPKDQIIVRYIDSNPKTMILPKTC